MINQKIQDKMTLSTMHDHVSLLETAVTKENYLDQVHQIFDIYGLGHGCLHNLGATYAPSEALWRVTPDDVTIACSNLIKMDKHPAIKLGKNRHFAFDLFDFRETFNNDPDVEALYTAFEANGLNQAYGLPIQTTDRGTFIFVIGRPNSPIETVELLTLQTICSNAVNKVHQFEARPCAANKTGKLTKQEMQLLIAIAKGKSLPDVSDEIGLSEITVRSMTNNILSKYKAQNVSHAIILALVEGEFELVDCISTN